MGFQAERGPQVSRRIRSKGLLPGSIGLAVLWRGQTRPIQHASFGHVNVARCGRYPASPQALFRGVVRVQRLDGDTLLDGLVAYLCVECGESPSVETPVHIRPVVHRLLYVRQAFLGDVVTPGCVVVVIVADDLTPVALQPVFQLDHELRHGPPLRRERREVAPDRRRPGGHAFVAGERRRLGVQRERLLPVHEPKVPHAPRGGVT
jgi:hypothetical protein